MRIALCLIVSLLFGGFAHAAVIADIEAALMNKDYTQVRKLSRDVLRSTSSSDDRVAAQYYLGLSELRSGQYVDARKAFQSVKNSSPSQVMYDKAALGTLEGLYMAGFYKDAAREGEALLHRSPDSQLLSLIYLRMARTSLKLMQWQEAKDYLNRVITQFPSSTEAPVARQLLEEKEYFTVQVGAFLEQDRAIQLTEDLKKNGQYAYMVETTSPEGQKFFRVRVGQITSLNDAQALGSKLSKLGYPALIYP